ncbi:MAG: exodeoxyribonuclease III [Candidatus Hodarchaeales archaeon]
MINRWNHERLLSWNVNGLRATIKKGFFKWLQEDSPDILAIQETKARPEQVSLPLTGLDYSVHFHSAERKGYSGVALFCKEKPATIRKKVMGEKFDNEGRVIIADYPGFSLYNVYFPNGKMSSERLQYKLEFYETFLELIERDRKNGKNIIFCGDVNTAHQAIDLARPKSNEKISGFLPVEREWMDKVVKHGYIDTFRHFNPEESSVPEERHYTWWSQRARGAREHNVGWRLDYYFVNKEFIGHVKSAFILKEVQGSDHCPVGIEITV